MKKIYDAAGVSLIIAIIFVSAFMLVLADLANVQLKTISAIRNRDMQGKTRYLLESAFELAKYWAYEVARTGQNRSTTEPALRSFNDALARAAEEMGITGCSTPDPVTGQPCIGFEVTQRPSRTDQQLRLNSLSYYTIPVKGTGNGSSSCANANEIDDSCNWNRLYLGQSVEIPLYYEEEGGTIRKLGQNSADDFKLRVRTPLCEPDIPASDCTDFRERNGRIVLYPQVTLATDRHSPFGKPDKDPVLIQWMIVDQNGTSTLWANDGTTETYIGLTRILKRSLFPSDNNEITGGRINDANPRIITDLYTLNDFIVLEKINMSISRPDKRTYEAKDTDRRLRPIIPYIGSPAMTRPMLRLTLVSQPRRDNDGTPSTELSSDALEDRSLDVPYLEYQLLTSDNIPIPDSKITIRAWAQLGDFRKETTQYLEREQTLGGFVLESM